MTDQNSEIELPLEDATPAEPEPAVVAKEEDEPPAPRMPEATNGGAPPWVKVPEGMRFPRGKQVLFVRFRAGMTDTPAKGERQAIAWPITVGDKKLALNRAMGDANRAPDELTKQMIRAVDGHAVDWSGSPGPGSIDQWWEEIGEKGRSRLAAIFVQLHIMDREETRDFFENCVAVRSTG